MSKFRTSPIPVFENHERFFKFIAIDRSTDCWNWISYSSDRNNGSFRISNRMYSPVRISYQIFCGELKDNMAIYNECKNKRCVNPDHIVQLADDEFVKNTTKKIAKEGTY